MPFLLLWHPRVSGGAPTPPPAVTTPTPAGRPSRESRRRYILPDGTNIFATRNEAEELIRRFATEKPKNRYAPKRVTNPAIVTDEDMVELVRFSPIKGDDGYRVKLAPKLEWKPEVGQYAAALAAFRRLQIEDDEEAIALLLMH